ncbi:EGF-like domain containing protein [Euroglyphus maynei]|uniref:EGF-like domain containing protein n=1 Tax=Euroglyphus maynei TaxID=6958 RepID=A0A1Y3AY24_EURMA|nr:EGF-like domain containing protein [Euroglyphus maynei]
MNSTDETYSCECHAGFTSDHCEININDCESNPCLNSGTCIDEINAFRCRCPPGFVGELCEVNIDECSMMKPCLNGATCVDRNNDYLCICPAGFTGKDCSKNIDDCTGSPCFNGGTCHDRINSFECECRPNYSGIRCEFLNSTANILLANSSLPFWAENSDDNLSNYQLSTMTTVYLLIITLLAIIFTIIGIIICRQIRHYGMKMKRRRDEADARRQNEHNAIMNSMNNNNKYLDLNRTATAANTNTTAANVIINSLHRPASIHQLNKCHKITNEYVITGNNHNNKCATLHNGFRAMNQFKEKTINNNNNNNNHYCSEQKIKIVDDPYMHTYEQIQQQQQQQPKQYKSNCNLLANNLSNNNAHQFIDQYSIQKQSNMDPYKRWVSILFQFFSNQL